MADIRCTNRRLLHCVALLALSLGGCTANRWQNVHSEFVAGRATTVDSEFRSRKPYIRATVNGRTEGWFLFDTGTPITAISPEAAARLGLRVIGEQASLDANRNRRVSPLGVADSVEFGPMRLQDVRFLLQDRPTLSYNDVIGVIGMNGLQGVTIDLDLIGGEFSITNERLSADGEGVVPLHRTKFAVPFIPVEFDLRGGHRETRTSWVLVDTGNSGGLRLDNRTSAAVADTNKARPIDVAVGSHDMRWLIAEAPLTGGMTLGDTRLEGARAVVNQQGNNIGIELLGEFRIQIDGVSRLAALTRSDGAARLVSLERLGITRLRRYGGAVHAEYVIPGSVADQNGLTHEDVIVAINGEKPKAHHLKADFWKVAPDAETIQLRIRRLSDGEELDIAFPIAW